MPVILIVDDDPVQRRLLEAALGKAGHTTISADSGETGLAALNGPRGGDIAVIVLDLMMPGMGGLGMLDALRDREVALPVVVQTAQGGIETVVGAMRRGAFDFVVKPVSPERIQSSVANALKLEARAAGSVRRPPARQGGGALSFRDLIAASPSMERVLRLGRKAAASNIPILLEGESGVGKEMIARAIQGSGERRSRPFVTVNCGAIPDNLTESILFGHEKGAFTGATERHPGKFVEADGGTLFLDEVGELPLAAQVKLLRAVQEGEVDPVGGRQTVKVDIRLISATNRDLIRHVKDGAFREDLYYRLNVFPIFVPPLRERRDDIPLLVQHFVARIGKSETGGRVKGISASALALLEAYDWPGNIRQLENAIFRAVVLAEGELLTADEFPQIRAQVPGFDLGDTAGDPVQFRHPAAAQQQAPGEEGEPAFASLAQRMGTLSALDDRGDVRSLSDVESDMIRFAIDHYDGQMSEVARRLGIGRSTLYRKLKDMGIEAEPGRPVRLAS
jgi:DNA-binding NtrC family response regulator